LRIRAALLAMRGGAFPENYGPRFLDATPFASPINALFNEP
jgi:hypothetical protein